MSKGKRIGDEEKTELMYQGMICLINRFCFIAAMLGSDKEAKTMFDLLKRLADAWAEENGLQI